MKLGSRAKPWLWGSRGSEAPEAPAFFAISMWFKYVSRTPPIPLGGTLMISHIRMLEPLFGPKSLNWYVCLPLIH